MMGRQVTQPQMFHKAAPFKRNDALLEELPVGLIAFPGSGITDNLVDKARKLGIPVMRSPRR